MTSDKPASITKVDLDQLQEFMAPIKHKYMELDKARELYLNDLRDKKLKIAAINSK